MSQHALESILPAHCFARALHLAGGVELLRRELGRPAELRPRVAVAGASPRECWFQAVAVVRKVDRLCRELHVDGVTAIGHPPPVPQLRPGHVLAVIELADHAVEAALQALGVDERGVTPARDDARTPSDVFGALATTSRQLNLLLERPFTPADVYGQVALAVGYASRVTRRESPVVAFARGKRPADCYERLRSCLDLARTVVRTGAHLVIADEPAPGDPAAVVPSDVYDLATLVLGEVVFIHAGHADTNPPPPFATMAPGRTLPSHVWQLAGVLEQQLQTLAR